MPHLPAPRGYTFPVAVRGAEQAARHVRTPTRAPRSDDAPHGPTGTDSPRCAETPRPRRCTDTLGRPQSTLPRIHSARMHFNAARRGYTRASTVRAARTHFQRRGARDVATHVCSASPGYRALAVPIRAVDDLLQPGAVRKNASTVPLSATSACREPLCTAPLQLQYSCRAAKNLRGLRCAFAMPRGIEP